MSDEHSVSRRASLKTLGATGALLVLGGTEAASRQGAGKPAATTQDTQAINVVDVAAGRFAKGHS